MTDVAPLWQRELNRASSAYWEQYAAHRERVTRLILSGGAGRLTVLGAGNCNDLDLDRILGRFDRVDLVDLDGEALAAGARRQGVAAHPKLSLHGDVDVTRLTQAKLDRLKGASVVASATLLTQLLDTAHRAGGNTADLLAARDTHLLLLADLLAPGGLGLLVTDVVSTDTCPEMRDTPADRLPQLLVDSIGAGNFFTGTNPFAIEQRLADDADLPVRSAGVTAPWRWEIGDRGYLVCAIRMRCSGRIKT